MAKADLLLSERLYSFLIVNECDGEDKSGQKYEKIVDGMKCYTTQQI